MSAVAHLSAIKASIPFMHFFDGFRTSHELNKINVFEKEDIINLIDQEALKRFRDKALNPMKPSIQGTAQNGDIYFQVTESRNNIYNDLPDVVNYYMEELNKFGFDYKPFNYYGSKNAKNVIVAMGSVCETIKETIDALGGDIGLIEVHLYRPFSNKHLVDVVPNTVKNIAVLDRTKDPAADGEPLYLDVVNALKDRDVKIIGGRYGLSSKNTTPAQIKAVFDFMHSNTVHHNFTIGINDDVTNLSLDIDENFFIPNDMTEFLIYGYGSDGMVSTSKDIIKMTMINGKILYKDNQFLVDDVKMIYDKCQQIIERMKK